MNIIKFEAENIKRLSAISIEPNQQVVVIGGKNGQGKSSILDSIMYAIAGAAGIPGEPIKKGSDTGHVSITFEDMVVTRKFTRKEEGTVSTLEIKNKDGFKTSSPQALLDSIRGKAAFDPLEFSRMKPRDQLDTLKGLVGIDFTELDAKRNDLYLSRAAINHDYKNKAAELNSKPFSKDAPENIIQVSDLMNELHKIHARDARLSGMELLQKQKHGLLEEINNIENKIKSHESVIKNMGDLSSREEVEIKINSAEAINIKIANNKDHLKLKNEAEELKKKSEELTQEISKVDFEKIRIMEEAPFPVESLGFDENGITLNNLPFQQASSAEQLRVSVAMGIAVNPKLKVMTIKDGSLLDNDSMKIIQEMAAESGMQIWIEKVGEGKDCSVIIYDGKIKEEGAQA